jgi:hypothetical protein
MMRGQKSIKLNELSEFSDVTPLDFCLWGWISSEVYKRKVDRMCELLASILDDAGCIRKREDRLR